MARPRHGSAKGLSQPEVIALVHLHIADAVGVAKVLAVQNGRRPASLWLRHLIPGLTIEHSPRSGFSDPAPLFEEESNILRITGRPDITHPTGIHRARPWARLTTHNDPIDALKIQVGE